VPACNACNGGFSKDDEYFRLMLVMRHDVGSHSAFSDLWPVVYESLERRRNHGFTNALLQSTSQVEVRSPAGLALGQLPTYEVDLVRLDRVASRIATGLFYHEFGSRLPDDYGTVSYNKSGVAGNLPGIQAIQALCAKLTTCQPKTIGSNVFSYWFQRTKEDLNASAWLFVFFGRVPFLCLTLPKSVAAKKTYTRTNSPHIDF